MEIKIRRKGNPYHLYIEPMPRIQDSYLDCVVFIYHSERDADRGLQAGGSGFLYGVQSKVSPTNYAVMAVSNRHVVLDPEMKTPTIRINTKDNQFDTIETAQEKWIAHPEDDLAVLPIGLAGGNWKYNFLKSDKHPITSEFIAEHNIGAGDNVFMTGRFIRADGKEQNMPSVRFGNLSNFPEQKIYNRFTGREQDSYMAEMRTVPGYSGSPVIFYIDPYEPRWMPGEKDDVPWNVGDTWYWRLIGIDWGFIPDYIRVLDKNDNKTDYRIKANTSMSCIVPISKLVSLLNNEPFASRLKKWMPD